MSPLKWALLLQAIYFFGLFFVKIKGEQSFRDMEIENGRYSRHVTDQLLLSILSFAPSFPLLLTLLSLQLHPTPWIFIYLLIYVVIFLALGIEDNHSTFIKISISSFVVLLINLKLAVNLTPTIAALMIFSSVIAILLLLYWIFERFLPKIAPPSTPENIIYLTVFLEMMSVAFWFFFEPMSATILGFAAAAGVCLLYLRSEITN